jgi:hypothetical protein
MTSVESIKEDQQKMREYCLRFRDVLESYNRSKYSGVFMCGWDSEYTQKNVFQNTCLSYQMATLFVENAAEDLNYSNDIYIIDSDEK